MNAIIHVLITFIGVGLVYYYFRNRLAVTEKKVDLMFQLIQEHERKSVNRPQFHPIIHPDVEEKGLICVSEDELDDDSDDDSDNDSDEVSDEEKIIYGETLIHGSTLGTDKIITLELNGEVNSESQEPYINNIVILNDADQKSAKDSDVESAQGSDVESAQGSDKGSDQDSAQGSDQDSGGEILLTEPKLNYKKATVAQLKELCETKNLTGFRSMRKQALIELLEK